MVNQLGRMFDAAYRQASQTPTPGYDARSGPMALMAEIGMWRSDWRTSCTPYPRPKSPFDP